MSKSWWKKRKKLPVSSWKSTNICRRTLWKKKAFLLLCKGIVRPNNNSQLIIEHQYWRKLIDKSMVLKRLNQMIGEKALGGISTSQETKIARLLLLEFWTKLSKSMVVLKRRKGMVGRNETFNPLLLALKKSWVKKVVLTWGLKSIQTVNRSSKTPCSKRRLFRRLLEISRILTSSRKFIKWICLQRGLCRKKKQVFLIRPNSRLYCPKTSLQMFLLRFRTWETNWRGQEVVLPQIYSQLGWRH